MTGRVACMLGVAAACASTPAAQPDPGWPIGRVVDEGVGDVGPLSSSFRVQPIDLAAPVRFDRVFELMGEGPWRFARTQGAVTALIPRSDYVGSTAVAVPDMLFVIGTPPPWLLADMGVARAGAVGPGRRLSYAVPIAAGVEPGAAVRAPGRSAPPAPALGAEQPFGPFVDDRGRAHRVRSLIALAAAHAGGG